MLGAVVRPSGAFLGTIPEGFRSEGNKMSCAAVRMPGRSTIKAAVAEAEAEAEAEAFMPPLAMGSGRKPMNLYEVLRVKKDASQSEIKSAYRSLAKIYHPDVAVEAKHPEESFDGCDFIEIRKAYTTLSDPAARAIYDLTLSIGNERRRPLVGAHNNNSSYGGFRRHSGFYTSRRWETDQCW